MGHRVFRKSPESRYEGSAEPPKTTPAPANPPKSAPREKHHPLPKGAHRFYDCGPWEAQGTLQAGIASRIFARRVPPFKAWERGCCGGPEGRCRVRGVRRLLVGGGVFTAQPVFVGSRVRAWFCVDPPILHTDPESPFRKHGVPYSLSDLFQQMMSNRTQESLEKKGVKCFQLWA